MNKFNINDEVFTMNNNQVIKFAVKKIELEENSDGVVIWYYNNFSEIKRLETQCFKTKEELLMSL